MARAEDLIPRRALGVAEASLGGFRAVVIQGARQAGKSTLAEFLAHRSDAAYTSLDREEDLTAAVDDPGLFLESIGVPAVIDEVQRAGDPLVLALKRRLDGSRDAGQYVLTGSSNFLTTPMLSESLAGRIDLITLWPLSVGELVGGEDRFVDRAFEGVDALLAHRGSTPGRTEYLELLCNGGYPEIQRLDPPLRPRWFRQYLETVLRREVASVADLRSFDALTAMARLLLVRTSSELVVTRLASDLGVDRSTAQSYEPWIEATFLIHRVPSWSRNVSSKIVRRPKLYACDTGLAAAVAGKDAQALARLNEPATGPLVETFVVGEIAKQLTWSGVSGRLYYLRDRGGLEVDAVIESPDGRVVAVEVKASTIARKGDALHLGSLRDRLDRVGHDFVAGVVLHTGDRRTRIDDRILGLPIADLWT